MAKRTREEALFGAACVKLRLERGQADASASIYQDLLRDLDVTSDEVDAYLSDHKSTVEAALRPRPKGPKN